MVWTKEIARGFGYFLLLLTILDTVNSIERCQVGYYYNRDLKKCERCSSCPVKEILRKPCTSNRDAVCGPFYEFAHFNLGGSQSHKKKHKSDNSNRSPAITNNPWESQTAHRSDEWMEPALTKDTPHTENKSEDYWKELCFGLVGALATVVLLAVVCVLFMMRARYRQGKPVMITDPENVNTYFRAQLLCQDRLHAGENNYLANIDSHKNGKHKKFLRRIYRPAAAWCSGKDYVDEVFELDRSGPFLLHAIPEATEVEPQVHKARHNHYV